MLRKVNLIVALLHLAIISTSTQNPDPECSRRLLPNNILKISCSRLQNAYLTSSRVNWILHGNETNQLINRTLEEDRRNEPFSYWISLKYSGDLRIDQKSFKSESNAQLKILDLNYNQIRSLYDGAFARLFHLERLRLKYNWITSLNRTKLAGMEKLKYLSIRGNVINTISPGTFNRKSMLKDLDLSENELINIQPETFRGLNSLEVLKLEHNMIEAIEDRSFAHMTLLKELDLSHNKLTSFSWQVFFGLVNLNFLTIRHNMMRTLSTSSDPRFNDERDSLIQAVGVICKKPGLTFVDLQGNGIDVLLNEASQFKVGFDYADPLQHFCHF